MNTLALDYRYQPRDPSRRVKGLLIVIALHALLVYALVSGMARKGLNLIKKPLEAVVIQEIILPPPPPPPPPKEIKAPEPLAPKTETAPPPPQPDLPPSVTSPVEPPPRDTPAPPIKPAAVTLAVPTPAPAPASDNSKALAASLEDEYASKVRAMLNASKRYPTGRAASQQRPQGKVKVWFTLGRAGALLDAGILESSNSNLLDDAAMATVRRSVYPPFPANTWVDQESHKFSAEIEFNPPSA